ncbi:MAG TPA: hypothetical protein VFQ99_05755 [Gallionella sp.]|nr:hypothetical protein [Gallionella sp.]
MALINCKECGKEVSTEATACPHCGAKPPKKSSGLMILFIIVGSVIALVLIISGSPGGRSGEGEQARRAECAKALLEGSRVTSYLDKQAYDKVVADKCAGYNIPK